MPDNVIKTDIQDYWRRSYVGDKEIPSSNVEWDVEVDYSTFLGGYIPIASGVGVGSILDITPSTAQTWLRYKVIDFVSGDSVTYTCKPDNGARAVCFIDSSNKILAVSEYVTPSASKSGSLKAPFGTKKAILQTSLDSNVSFVINRNSSRLYAGDKEVDIMYAGDKVAYAKHKDNLLKNEFANKSNSVTFNLNNGSHKITRSMSISDNYIGLKNTEAVSIGDKITISFDVTDFYSPTNAHWNFYSAELGNNAATKFVIDHVGHYCKSGLAVRNRAALTGCSIIDDVSGECTMAEGDYFIIKNIKLERNIVDTEYSLAPSVTPQNRVKIGKHWYNTCTIGSQEWLSENLNEDLKDVVVKDVDWSKFAEENIGYVNLFEAEVGSTLNVQINSNSSYGYIIIPVSVGEVIDLDGIHAPYAKEYCVLDSSNKVLMVSSESFTGKITMPEGASRLIYNLNRSYATSKCIQSTHTSEGTWEGYYNNDASYGVKGYGKLYTWDCICSANETPSAAMAALLKDGWRVPTKDDFNTWLTTVGPANYAKAKEKWYWQTAGTNESGFSAIGGGYKSSAGAFLYISEESNIFSSTINSTPWYLKLYYNQHTICINIGSNTNKSGYSVRLVRDVPVTLSAPPTTGSAYVASVDGNVGWVSE